MWRWGKRTGAKTSQGVKTGSVAPTTGESQKELQCPLCGKKFSAGEAAACSACLLAAKCGLVMCPNCSYEFAL